MQDIAAIRQPVLKSSVISPPVTKVPIPMAIFRAMVTLAANEQSITDMAKIDGVNGVFIDECSAFPDQKGKDYLTALASLATVWACLPGVMSAKQTSIHGILLPAGST